MKDYDTEIAQKRIEVLCAQKGTKPTIVARESGAGANSIANLKRGSMLSADKLAKIADYLECSVDYILGRTDEPIQTMNNVSVSNPQNFNGTQNNGIIQTSDEKISSDDEQLLEMIKSLDLIERSKIIVMIDEMRKGA